MDKINEAINILNSGGVILYNTETICGLGCLTNFPKAIDKIYKIKQRDSSQKLILLIHNEIRLNSYVREVPEIAWDIIDYSQQQPTIIYENAYNLSENLISEDGSIAIRLVQSGPLHHFLSKLKTPLTSTSANVSGKTSPLHLKEVSKEILSKVDFILDLPNLNSSKRPSSIIKLKSNGEVKIIRE